MRTNRMQTLMLMRDIIVTQEHIVKGSQSKKAMLDELAKLRVKTDKMLSEMAQNKVGREIASPMVSPKPNT